MTQTDRQTDRQADRQNVIPIVLDIFHLNSQNENLFYQVNCLTPLSFCILGCQSSLTFDCCEVTHERGQ